MTGDDMFRAMLHAVQAAALETRANTDEVRRLREAFEKVVAVEPKGAGDPIDDLVSGLAKIGARALKKKK